MPSRLIRRSFVLAATAALLALPGAAQARPLIGLSDQTTAAFSSPLFAPLHMRAARLVTPWNSIFADPGRLDAWITAARGAGVKPLVSFEHSASDRCPDQPCSAPLESDYAKAIAAFHARYPGVTDISAWNEANHKTQPTYRDPLLAAQYYKIAKRECAGCTVVAADVLDEPNMVRWLTQFKVLAGGARLWGLHNYGDTNRFRTTGTAKLLATVKGAVWLTETGAIVSFTTSKGVNALPRSETRAARSMRYLYKKLIPSSKRIKRAYIYNWAADPANRFDSGLIGPDGRPRQTYEIVKSHAG